MHQALEVRAYAIGRLHGPHLYLLGDGSLEFAWVHFAEFDVDWDGDESGWMDREEYEYARMRWEWAMFLEGR